MTELKPKRTIRTFVAWDCGAGPAHTHRTESGARNCMEKHLRKIASRPTRQWTREAMAEVLASFRSGEKQADIARSLNLSSERVRQIIAKAKRVERAGEPETGLLDGLCVRTRNALMCEDLYTREDVMAAYGRGDLPKLPNIGATSLFEIRHWLGVA